MRVPFSFRDTRQAHIKFHLTSNDWKLQVAFLRLLVQASCLQLNSSLQGKFVLCCDVDIFVGKGCFQTKCEIMISSQETKSEDVSQVLRDQSLRLDRDHSPLAYGKQFLNSQAAGAGSLIPTLAQNTAKQPYLMHLKISQF